jgi:NAD(P)-dependent dehydrogenase (short-subunit alcohol dehydrogenase family)
LDLLIHNAGIFGIPAMRNSAGHEMHFATNYLGAFALTGLLLSVFGDAAGTRVVSVGSLAHRFGRLSLHKLSFDELNYNPWRAYARSKVALLSFTLELNRRLAKQGSKITALCAHPGFAPTNIGASHSVTNPKTALGKWFTEYMRANMQTVTEAARPILHAACADGPSGGEYYGPGGWFEIGGAPARARLARGAQDARLANELWSASESLTGIRYLSGAAAKRAI